MRYSIPVKFIAFLLAVCLVVACGVFITSIVFLENNELYTSDLDTQHEQWYKTLGHRIAWVTAHRYAAEQFGKCSNSILDALYGKDSRQGSQNWHVVISSDGHVLREISNPISDGTVLVFNILTEYPVATPANQVPSPVPSIASAPTSAGDVHTPTAPSAPIEEPVTDSLYRSEIEIWERGVSTDYLLEYYKGPAYQVTVTMTEKAFESTYFGTLMLIYPYRIQFIFFLIWSLVLASATLIFLFTSAGRAKDGSVHLSGLSRLPLDLYLVMTVLVEWPLVYVFVQAMRWIGTDELNPGNLTLLILNAVAIMIPILGYLYSIAAQVKLESSYWWRHSLIGRVANRIVNAAGLGIKGFLSLFTMVPLMWKWFSLAVVMAASLLISFFVWQRCLLPWSTVGHVLFWVSLFVTGAIVCYGGYAFGTLLIGTKKMADGDLGYKIPTKHLFGSYKQHAQRVNALSETAMVAAQNHLKAEQTKSELITNVSHDIKTPLTSIINFVDLLAKPHTPEEQTQYLEVLSRQSLRLKRLIEDLMELSKANTGNITVNIAELDAAETVNQALGEFSDKLENARLTPIFRAPEEPLTILADGRLTWRVLSNLLSNAVKYALPDSRLYIDLMQAEDQVLLSLKNVSRDPLRGSSEALMERFVQGDASRSTEGSGLGLNIAKSLMEVQGGKLQLLTDGDLFKVTLIFPKA